jgi:type II secretory ATPase GspE/PulE/Tfp pilus assembly ATPase PilB-like protein
MAGLSIAQRGLNQNGFFKVQVGNLIIDVQVSILPEKTGDTIILSFDALDPPIMSLPNQCSDKLCWVKTHDVDNFEYCRFGRSF